MIKVILTAGSDELNGRDLDKVMKLNSKYFIYFYKIGDWSGSGWAMWDLPDNKFGYTSLSHCSCNGPVEDLNSIPYTLDEIKKLSRFYSECADPVIEMVEKLL